jgi:lipopolysaccharide export system protein LptA
VVTPAQLSGPQGDLRANRIDVILGEKTSRAERLEAYTGVNMRIDTRVATGDRLTYFSEDERYVMSGIATVPVTIIEECRETSGRTVTFFKSAERIIVDGREEVRTQSRRGPACPAAPPR